MIIDILGYIIYGWTAICGIGVVYVVIACLTTHKHLLCEVGWCRKTDDAYSDSLKSFDKDMVYKNCPLCMSGKWVKKK